MADEKPKNDEGQVGNELNPKYKPVKGADEVRKNEKKKANLVEGNPNVKEVHLRVSNGSKSVDITKVYTSKITRDKSTGKIRFTKTKVSVRKG